jgi:hypothetical protein
LITQSAASDTWNLVPEIIIPVSVTDVYNNIIRHLSSNIRILELQGGTMEQHFIIPHLRNNCLNLRSLTLNSQYLELSSKIFPDLGVLCMRVKHLRICTLNPPIWFEKSPRRITVLSNIFDTVPSTTVSSLEHLEIDFAPRNDREVEQFAACVIRKVAPSLQTLTGPFFLKATHVNSLFSGLCGLRQISNARMPISGRTVAGWIDLVSRLAYTKVGSNITFGDNGVSLFSEVIFSTEHNDSIVPLLKSFRTPISPEHISELLNSMIIRSISHECGDLIRVIELVAAESLPVLPKVAELSAVLRDAEWWPLCFATRFKIPNPVIKRCIELFGFRSGIGGQILEYIMDGSLLQNTQEREYGAFILSLGMVTEEDLHEYLRKALDGRTQRRISSEGLHWLLSIAFRTEDIIKIVTEKPSPSANISVRAQISAEILRRLERRSAFSLSSNDDFLSFLSKIDPTDEFSLQLAVDYVGIDNLSSETLGVTLWFACSTLARSGSSCLLDFWTDIILSHDLAPLLFAANSDYPRLNILDALRSLPHAAAALLLSFINPLLLDQVETASSEQKQSLLKFLFCHVLEATELGGETDCMVTDLIRSVASLCYRDGLFTTEIVIGTILLDMDRQLMEQIFLGSRSIVIGLLRMATKIDYGVLPPDLQLECSGRVASLLNRFHSKPSAILMPFADECIRICYGRILHSTLDANECI